MGQEIVSSIKKIHVVWVGPHDPPTEMIKTWDDKHTDGWFILPWRDHTGWINQAQIDVMFNKTNREFNGAADIIRWEIMLKYGGFAVDADSECIKSLDSGPEDFVREAETKVLLACENEAVRPGVLGCGFIGGPAGHPFFKRCVEECALIDPHKPAWTTVGPALATRIAGEMPDAVHVLPAKYFNPMHYTGTAAPGSEEPGFIPYAKQAWGSTRGYGVCRRRPCWCKLCRQTALRPPWGGFGGW